MSEEKKCCGGGCKRDRQKIAERAYYKWVEAGSPKGDGVQYWLEAEREMTRADVELEEVVEVELNPVVSDAEFLAELARA